MASSVVAYVAVSLDGFIAGDDGLVDFLNDFGSEEYAFHEFMESIGALVMGSATYEQILGWGWPYGEIPALVLTTQELAVAEGATITFSEEATGDAIRSYGETTDRRLWIVGGGRVIVDAMQQGVVDTLELYVMPVALGSGVPLFPERFDGTLTLLDSTAFSNGVVRLTYRPDPT